MSSARHARSYFRRTLLILPAFWLSGVAAILYQLIWQRVLSGSFGVTSETVTIVVSGFMLGLGLGSLAGGAISKRVASPTIFACAEFALGIFGVFSVSIFRWVGAATMTLPGDTGLLLASLVLLVPTALMGATLPLLVAWLLKKDEHVGHAVAGLYFANTLGSAVGAAGAVVFVVGTFGQEGTARVAALLNGIAAAIGLWAVARERSAR